MDPLLNNATNLANQAVPTNAAELMPQESDSNFIGSAIDSISNFGKNLGSSIEQNLQESSYGKFLRRIGLLDSEPAEYDFEGASWAQESERTDWRVRLSIPPTYESSTLLNPLLETKGFVFPYTPSIQIQHTAAYNPIKPVHNNFSFHGYQNSTVDNITISGDFFIETALEGHYWIAAVHYLRSVTKMAYGATPNIGSPPPIVKLNGYGDYVFNNVPVAIQNFAVDLAPDVDYIFCKGLGTTGSHVPTKSTITVSLIPVYSRRAVQRFSLQDFVNGAYLNTGFI